MLYRVGFELTTLVVIGTGCIGSCKSNYHTSTTMTTPTIHLERLEFNTNTFFEFDTTVVTPRLWVNKKHLKNNIKYHTYIFNLTCPLNMNTASELHLTMYIYKQNSANLFGKVHFLFLLSEFHFNNNKKAKKKQNNKTNSICIKVAKKSCTNEIFISTNYKIISVDMSLKTSRANVFLKFYSLCYFPWKH